MQHDELTQIKEAIISALPDVKTIYLFGSRAKGNAKDDSDYDIYAVIQDGSLRPLVAMQIINRFIRVLKISKPVDILVSSNTDFLKRKELPTIEKNVAKEGVVIYGNEITI